MSEPITFDVSPAITIPNALPPPRDRNLYLTTQVTQASISDISRNILEINSHDALLKKQYAVHDIEYKPKPITLYIDSYGGVVYQCLGLLGIMDTSKTPIYTVVTGTAMSCGFLISIHGHKRMAYKHSTLMYHQVSSGNWGKVLDLEEDLEEVKRLQALIEELTIKKTKIKMEKIKSVYERKQDWYMDAETALKNGCIDHIIQ